MQWEGTPSVQWEGTALVHWEGTALVQWEGTPSVQWEGTPSVQWEGTPSVQWEQRLAYSEYGVPTLPLSVPSSTGGGTCDPVASPTPSRDPHSYGVYHSLQAHRTLTLPVGAQWLADHQCYGETAGRSSIAPAVLSSSSPVEALTQHIAPDVQT